MLRIYNTVLLPLRLGVAVWGRLPGRTPEKRREWDERRAVLLPPRTAGGIWIHGASVGESRIVSGLARALRDRRVSLPIAVSALTPTGYARLPRPPAVAVTFHAPLDFPGGTRRVVEALAPAGLALVETELWPNLLAAARAADVPVALLNARLSPERMRRYRRFAGLYRPLVRGLEAIGARSEADAARLIELGARDAAIEVTGDVKYDLPRPPVDPLELRERLGLTRDRPVVVAGSTGRGEELLVLQAFERVRADFENTLLILAPRHPPRADAVAELIAERGLTLTRITRDPGAAGSRDVLLVDSVGELAALYLLADVSFVGGTLVPVGGHDVLEPAVCGSPVLFGPHTHHVREPTEALIARGGALRVRDAAELAEQLARLLGDDDARRRMAKNAARIIDDNRGALDRSAELLLEMTDRVGRPPGVGSR